MTASADPSVTTRHSPQLRPFARALVASDASLAADGAVRVAAALEARDGAVLSGVSVVEPTSYPAPVNDLALAPTAARAADDAAIHARRDDVLRQYARLGLTCPEDLLVECSVPLSGILFQATARKAELLILGLGRHKAVDRLFGSETALHAVREADVATLAVPASMTSLPRHAVIGTDFDGSSLAAVRAAARLVGPNGRITLVHVDPLAEPLPAMLADWPAHVLDRINDAFARQIAQIGLPESLQIETMALAGNVSKELTTYAAKVNADLIAVGRHSRSLVERMVLGSSTTRVIRTATCAVLVVPREA
jgi:nucleotide-binding universal stress UspA family protein